MAKIVITIEDTPRGTVKTHVDPSYELMMKITVNSNDLTPAHVYALAAINAMRKMSKEAKPVNILIPRVRRGMN